MMEHVYDPRNANQSVFNLYLDEIAAAEAIEIDVTYRDALDAMAFAPRGDNKPPARQGPSHREFPKDAGFLYLRWGAVEGAIGYHQHRQQPRERNQAVVNPLQGLDFQVAQGAALEPDRQGKRQKKQNTNENQDSVEFQGRVTVARSYKRKRAQHEERCTIQEFLAKRKFGGRRIEPAGIADVRVPLCSAIQAACHFTGRTLEGAFAKQTMFSSRPFASSWQSISCALRMA
jgi:hypothetical protein